MGVQSEYWGGVVGGMVGAMDARCKYRALVARGARFELPTGLTEYGTGTYRVTVPLCRHNGRHADNGLM